MKLFYVSGDRGNAVVHIGDFSARIWRNGIRPYKRQSNAAAYLASIATEDTKLNEPDEIIPKEDSESIESFEDRIVGETEHIACFERIFPRDRTKSLETPKTYYKCLNLFSGDSIWYITERDAKKDCDGMTEIFIGAVEVYDPAEIKRLDEIIASFSTD